MIKVKNAPSDFPTYKAWVTQTLTRWFGDKLPTLPESRIKKAHRHACDVFKFCAAWGKEKQLKRLQRRTFKAEANLLRLMEAGVLIPGPNFPEVQMDKQGLPMCNVWLSMCIQEDPLRADDALSSVEVLLRGGEVGDGPTIPVPVDTCFDAVFESDAMPWSFPNQ